MQFSIYSLVSVVLLSMFKCIAGILTGIALQLPLYVTIIGNIIGMLLTVIIVSFTGPFLKKKIINRWFPVKKLFSKKNRKIIKVWNSYGLIGVAFLTPILLMPLGGTLIAISFGERPVKIILYMFISIIFWANVLTFIMYSLKNAII